MSSSTDIPGAAQPGSLAGDAAVQILIADYAAADVAGKLNIVGAGWTQTGRNVLPGQPYALTPPQAVVVAIELPPKYADEQFAIALQLVDERGDTVSVTNPLAGQDSPLRIQQLVTAAGQVGVPQSLGLPARVQAVFNMPTGLPLEPNRLYRWALEIDGHRRDEWRAAFYVRPDPTGPIHG